MIYPSKFVRILVNPDLAISDVKRLTIIVTSFITISISWLYLKEIAYGGQFFKTGDWLINYEGGFIRRGLIGQMLLMLSKMGVDILWGTYILQLACYLITSFLVIKLIFFKERLIFWVSIIFSPAFFYLLPFYDSGASFRKEILVFLSYSLLATCLTYTKKSSAQVALLVSSVICFFFASIAHEAAVFCIPFFLFLLCLLKKSNHAPDCRYIFAARLAFLFTSAFTLIIAYKFPGNQKAALSICQSLISNGLEPYMCDGAIAWLKAPVSNYQNQVLELIKNNNYLSVYGALFILSFLPIFFTDWLKKRWHLSLIGFISFLPLFYITSDWGRWLGIYFFMIFITMMVDPIRINIVRVPLLLILFYISTWSIPHFGGNQIGKGLINVYKSFANPLYASSLNPALWNQLGKYYSRVEDYPQNGVYSQRYWVNYLANTYSLKSKARNQENLFNHVPSYDQPDLKTFYLVSDQASVVVRNRIDHNRDFYGRLDNLNVLAPGWKACVNCKQFTYDLEIQPTSSQINANEIITFSNTGNGTPYVIGVGSNWSFPEAWGIWSTGHSAGLSFPVEKFKPTMLTLVATTLITPKHDHQIVDIYINGVYIKKIKLTDEKPTNIVLPLTNINLDQGYISVDFNFPNTIIPKEHEKGNDSRELALGLTKAFFSN